MTKLKVLGGAVAVAWLLACAQTTSTPRSCPSGGSGGFVDVEFDLSASGEVENPRILRSCPPGKFDEATLNAVKDWKYEPTGSPRKNVRQRLKFDLPE